MHLTSQLSLYLQVNENNSNSGGAAVDVTKAVVTVETLTMLIAHQFAYVLTTGPYMDREETCATSNTALGLYSLTYVLQ